MNSVKFLTLFLLFALSLSSALDVAFDETYAVTWGQDHFNVFDQGTRVQLSLDSHSGSGFESKSSYKSGFFHMRMKLENNNNTAGVVTTFYLTSNGSNHDELDMEFLGDVEGKPITLQTNVFANGEGNREQRVNLWFDPKEDFHSYKILWNQHLIVFYVDDTPIRVFKNNTSIGVAFPTQPMKVTASIWDGSNWATDGGRTKVNWSYAPFKAQYMDFHIDGCPMEYNEECYGLDYSWNQAKYWKLGQNQQKKYEQVRENYVTYDYCGDRERYPNAPPECAFNS